METRAGKPGIIARSKKAQKRLKKGPISAQELAEVFPSIKGERGPQRPAQGLRNKVNYVSFDSMLFQAEI